MRSISKPLLFCSAAIAALFLTYCKACKPRGEATIENSGAFILIKNVELKGKIESIPMRDVYLKSKDNKTGELKLVRPYHPANGEFLQNSPEALRSDTDLKEFDKSVTLDPYCFSTQYYEPQTDIRSINLTEDNTTITVLNFTEDGRLESLELPKNNQGKYQDSNVADILSPNIANTRSGSEYEQLQYWLSRMTPNDFNNQTSPQSEFEERDLIDNNVPLVKTPHYSDLKNQASYKDAEGHIYVYVLLDKQVRFTREYAALVQYAPETEDALMKLYTPLFQQPIYPDFFDPNRLDVLTFRYVQNPKVKPSKKEKCSYVYDLHVLSTGQDESGHSTSGTPTIREHSTPLFIDPEIKTKGVIVNL